MTAVPTLARMRIPPPRDWGEFENIALSALRIRWDSPNLQKHGRSGQPQNGVDLYGDDDLGRHAGVQCKLGPVAVNEIEAEIAKAETFAPPLDAFFIATTAAID